MPPSDSFLYRAYGLILLSDVPLPGLRQDTDLAEPDIVLTLGSQPSWVTDALNLSPCVEHPKTDDQDRHDPGFTLTSLGGGEFFQLAYGDGTRFLVDRIASRVWGSCPLPLSFEDLVTYLCGPVLGFVLRRRGTVSLHASCITIEGHAVVLCGESEAGKSTTAAVLALAGAGVLTEDVVPLKEEQGTFCVESGYPRICLWPSAVELLVGHCDALPPLTPNWEKRFLPLDGARANFDSQRRPLGVIYLLAPRTDADDAPRIENVSPREALLDLVQNTYMNSLLGRSQRAAELDVLSRIVARVSVRRLVPHADPARLTLLRHLIVSDATRLIANRAAIPVSSG